MNTKKCPYCHEEISEDAILCKYCHNLLTEDDEEETAEYQPESDNDERTRIFSAAEAVKNSNQQSVRYDDDDDYDNDDDDYDDEYDDDDSDDDDDDDYDESAAKKTFITAAIITFGVLLIVIIAIFAGYKIFGGKDNEDSKAPALNSSMVLPESQPDSQPAAPADTSVSAPDSSDDSQAPADSTPDSSVPDDTSSVPDSSEPDSSVADSSVPDESSTPAADIPENNDEIVNKITEALKAYNDTGVDNYTFRAEDSAQGSVKFYYFFMNDGKGYSVAYNTTTDNIIIRG